MRELVRQVLAIKRKFISRLSLRFTKKNYLRRISDKNQILMKAKLSAHYIASDYFINIRVRHKFPSSQVRLQHPDIQGAGRCAIVVQGPLFSKFDFTYWTLRALRNNNPTSAIIFSTWDSISKTEASRIQNLGVVCTVQKMPDGPEVSNLQLQGMTTNAGLEVAKSVKAEYVFKQRSDQRMARPNLMSSLLAIYEMESKSPLATKRQGRPILALSSGTLKFRLYGLCDFAQFGSLDTIASYWHEPIVEAHINQRTPQTSKGVQRVTLSNDTRLIFEDFKSRKSIQEKYFYENLGAEQLLFLRFLERLGCRPSWNLVDYWTSLAKYALIVDGASLDFFWPKYSFLEKFDLYNFNLPDRELVTFADWLSYRQGL